MKASTSLQDSKKSNSGTPHGACLTLTDHDRIRQFIQEFTFRGLLPHIEKTIRQLNDQVSLPLKILCAIRTKNGWGINPVIQKSVLTVLLPSASNDSMVLLKTQSRFKRNNWSSHYCSLCLLKKRELICINSSNARWLLGENLSELFPGKPVLDPKILIFCSLGWFWHGEQNGLCVSTSEYTSKFKKCISLIIICKKSCILQLLLDREEMQGHPESRNSDLSSFCREYASFKLGFFGSVINIMSMLSHVHTLKLFASQWSSFFYTCFTLTWS